jgi:diamine N-acetyltransferase
MTIRIRTAALADYEELCAVLEEGDALHREKLPAFFRKSPDGQTRAKAYVADLLDDPYTALLVAEERATAGAASGEARIHGAVIVILRETPPVPILVPRRFALVENVIVRAGQRGRGIGQALMKAAEAWAQSMDAETVELTVYLFNKAAIRFYEELGYTGLNQRMIKRCSDA